MKLESEGVHADEICFCFEHRFVLVLIKIANSQDCGLSVLGYWSKQLNTTSSVSIVSKIALVGFQLYMTTLMLCWFCFVLVTYLSIWTPRLWSFPFLECHNTTRKVLRLDLLMKCWDIKSSKVLLLMIPKLIQKLW